MAIFVVNGLREVTSDLARAQSRATNLVEAIAEKGANNVKTSLNAALGSSVHFKGASGSVTYDQKTRFGSVEYEVGPDKSRRGGALGNIAFFGTSRGGGTVDLDGPVRAEAERFRSQMQNAIGGLL